MLDGVSGTLLPAFAHTLPQLFVAGQVMNKLIGTLKKAGAPGDNTTGSAYVFSLNGTLLAMVNNPTPGVGDRFGLRLVAFGNDGVIIGAPQDSGVGSAYLFSVPSSPTPPSLTIHRTTTTTVAVSWPSTVTGFVLQQNTNGVSSVNWSNVTDIIQDDGTDKTLIVNPTVLSRFYRLKQNN